MEIMTNRRIRRRIVYRSSGFFLQDGDLSMVKVRDATTGGMGILAKQKLEVGLQGVMFARLENSPEIMDIPCEVCWCFRDITEGYDQYKYRIGLRILGDFEQKVSVPQYGQVESG